MRSLIIAAFALLAASCTREAAAPPVPAAPPILASAEARDIHSFARPQEARVTHVALDLALDFAAKRVHGTATLDIEARPGVGEIVLDSKGLEIGSVTNEAGQKLPFAVGAADPNLGAPLTVTLRK